MKLFKSKEHGYVLELWGASTKHPDTIFYFDNFKKSDFFTDEVQVFQWLLECASKLNFPMHAYAIAEEAMKSWYPMDKNWKAPELEEYNQNHWHENYRCM